MEPSVFLCYQCMSCGIYKPREQMKIVYNPIWIVQYKSYCQGCVPLGTLDESK